MKKIVRIFFIGAVFSASVSLQAQWSLTGNNVTATQYLGTTAGDTDPLNIRTNGVNRITVTSAGNVGIGTTNPSGILQVNAATATRNITLSGGATITNARLKSTQWNLSPTDGAAGSISFITSDWDNNNGFGFITAANVSSPVVWMYNYSGRNAFTIARKTYQGTGNNASQLEQALTPLFQVRENGNVGIGTTNPGNFKLAVEGAIGARQIVVTQNAWADFVFQDHYRLKPLHEVEKFIKENRHLPDVPSEKDVLKDGVNLGNMDAVLLQKIEEMTLYIIDLKKQVDTQARELLKLKNEKSADFSSLTNK